MDSDIHMSGGGYLFAYDSIFGVGVDSQRNNDGGGNLIAVDPQLAPLGDYGGPVPTMPPLAGSPAVDIGVTGFPFPVLKTDARGRPRSMDGDNDGIAKPDAGAAEYDPSSHTTP